MNSDFGSTDITHEARPIGRRITIDRIKTALRTLGDRNGSTVSSICNVLKRDGGYPLSVPELKTVLARGVKAGTLEYHGPPRFKVRNMPFFKSRGKMKSSWKGRKMARRGRKRKRSRRRTKKRKRRGRRRPRRRRNRRRRTRGRGRRRRGRRRSRRRRSRRKRTKKNNKSNAGGGANPEPEPAPSEMSE